MAYGFRFRAGFEFLAAARTLGAAREEHREALAIHLGIRLRSWQTDPRPERGRHVPMAPEG